MSDGPHEIHITGWDGGPISEVRCNSKAGAPCRMEHGEDGGEPTPRDACLVAEWFDEVGPDLASCELAGQPPWQVLVAWSSDGPELHRRRWGHRVTRNTNPTGDQ